jgi:hypothetical protein
LNLKHGSVPRNRKVVDPAIGSLLVEPMMPMTLEVTLAAPRHVNQVAQSLSAAAERPPECGDVLSQVALLDKVVGPHTCDQLLVAEHLTRVFNQGDQEL